MPPPNDLYSYNHHSGGTFVSQHYQEQIQEQIAVLTSSEFHTQYASVIPLQRLWQSWQISAHLDESKIRYGQMNATAPNVHLYLL